MNDVQRAIDPQGGLKLAPDLRYAGIVQFKGPLIRKAD